MTIIFTIKYIYNNNQQISREAQLLFQIYLGDLHLLRLSLCLLKTNKLSVFLITILSQSRKWWIVFVLWKWKNSREKYQMIRKSVLTNSAGMCCLSMIFFITKKKFRWVRLHLNFISMRSSKQTFQEFHSSFWFIFPLPATYPEETKA